MNDQAEDPTIESLEATDIEVAMLSARPTIPDPIGFVLRVQTWAKLPNPSMTLADAMIGGIRALRANVEAIGVEVFEDTYAMVEDSLAGLGVDLDTEIDTLDRLTRAREAERKAARDRQSSRYGRLGDVPRFDAARYPSHPAIDPELVTERQREQRAIENQHRGEKYE